VVGGGPPINNDDRDRTVSSLALKGAYEFMPETAVFVRASRNAHDFEDALDDDGFNRDSDGWRVEGGLDLRLTHVLTGEVSAGYQRQDYDDAAFESVDGLSFGAGLKWFPTMLTTLTLDAARTIEDTSIAGASSYVSSRGELAVHHELMRNVVVSATASFENADYERLDRDDDIIRGGLAAAYLIDQNFKLRVGWNYVDRASDDPEFDFTTNRVFVALTTKL
jgi:hypothetical protein